MRPSDLAALARRDVTRRTHNMACVLADPAAPQPEDCRSRAHEPAPVQWLDTWAAMAATDCSGKRTPRAGAIEGRSHRGHGGRRK